MNTTLKPTEFYQQWKHEGNNYLRNIESSASKARTTSAAAVTAASSVQSKSHKRGFYVKLANESIPRCSDSEDPKYDSFNEHETDYCRDTSDSDDYDTDGIATMDVIEYEIDDTSSSSDDLYSHGSSSGIDDFVKVVEKAIFGDSTSSDEFEIFAGDADTEASDGPTDPELGPADYWTCIKCKNKKNNPMYRFCEKCYQVRKTHFPPRPKNKKKRRKNSERLLLKNVHKLPGSPSASLLSSPSSSGLSASEGKPDGQISHNSSDEDSDIGKLLNSNSSKRPNVRKQKQPAHNSAGDSSCCSAQELSPDEQQPGNSKYLDACPSSQETYCSEIERIVDKTKQNSQINCSNFDSNYPNSQESIYSVSQELSSNELLMDKMCGKSHAVKLVETSSTASSGFHSLSSQSEEQIRSDSCEINSDDMLNVNNNEDNNNSKSRRAVKRKIEVSNILSDNSDDEYTKKVKKSFGEFVDSPANDLCNICFLQPKDSAFVHAHRLHVYCCYRCAVKVWTKCKRCPVCNSQAKNVMKMFVH